MTFTSPAERVVLCGVWQVRSFVGLIPLFATLTIEEATLDKLPAFKCVGGIPYFSRCRHWHTLTHACVCMCADRRRRLEWFLKYRPKLVRPLLSWLTPQEREGATTSHLPNAQRRLLSLVPKDKLLPILSRMLDEDQFLGPYGLRSLSKEHLARPYRFSHGEACVWPTLHCGTRVLLRGTSRLWVSAVGGVLAYQAASRQRSSTNRQSRHHPCTAATRTGVGLFGCR